MCITSTAADFMNELLTKLHNFSKSQMFMGGTHAGLEIMESVKPPDRKWVVGNKQDTRKTALHIIKEGPRWEPHRMFVYTDNID